MSSPPSSPSASTSSQPTSPQNKRQRSPTSPDKCSAPLPDMATPNRALEQRIRAVIANESDPQKRQSLISQLYAESRKQHLPVVTCNHSFPGKGASSSCPHYSRYCWVKAPCCDKYYQCRRCHDSNEMHEIDRYAIKEVACVRCGDMDQPVAEKCRSCQQRFADYFCGVCNFYDDTPERQAYHCEHCGMCRVGKGLGKDQYHCHRCNNCVPMDVKDSHPCRERSLDANCPICAHYLASSTEQVCFTRCGHPMHQSCLEQHAETSYTCPMCHKSLTDMSEYFEALDKRLAQDVIPLEFANRVSTVFCHDCEEKTNARFHFVYHKCGGCGSYNTRVLTQFDDPSGTASSIPMAAAAAASTRQQHASQQRTMDSSSIQDSATT